MQVMQDQMTKPCEYSRPSYEHQPHKFNNSYDGKRNVDNRRSNDHPKQSNVVSEECSTPKREECSYSPNHVEVEISPTDECVHMLTEEDIYVLFTTCEIQPFNVLEEAL